MLKIQWSTILLFVVQSPASEGDMGMDDAVEISFASAAEIPVLSRPQDRQARQPPDKTRARARTVASTTRHHLQLSVAMSVYCCLNPNECTSSEGAFSAAASVHPEKIIAPTSASEGDQRPQTIVESYPVPVLVVEFISASRTEGEQRNPFCGRYQKEAASQAARQISQPHGSVRGRQVREGNRQFHSQQVYCCIAAAVSFRGRKI